MLVFNYIADENFALYSFVAKALCGYLQLCSNEATCMWRKGRGSLVCGRGSPWPLTTIASHSPQAMTTTLSGVTLAVLLLCTSLTGPAGAAPLKPRLEATKQLLSAVSEKAGRQSGLTCDLCKAAAGVLDELFLRNSTQDEIVKVITYICITFDIEDTNVCTLVVKEFQVRPAVHRSAFLSSKRGVLGHKDKITIQYGCI